MDVGQRKGDWVGKTRGRGGFRRNVICVTGDEGVRLMFFNPIPPSGDFPFAGEEFRYYQIVFVGARLLGASLLTALFP